VSRSAPGLSVAIIARDEEENLPACLASVAWADEIVVCDSGSRDRTVEIAREHGARTFQDAWRGFAAHKALAVSRCTQPWVLILDADERVPAPLGEEIREVLRRPDAADGYTVARRNYFLGAWIRHGGWYPDRSLRLFRAGRGHLEPRAVHEAVQVSGRVIPLTQPMEHHTYRSVGAFLQRTERYAGLAAEELWAAGRRCRLTDLSLRPAWTFLRMYLLQRGILDGRRGFILAALYAGYTFAKYARLWELAEHKMRHTERHECGMKNDLTQR
jgi:glycosyltransferase involved in cell wall biosynthesis